MLGLSRQDLPTVSETSMGRSMSAITPALLPSISPNASLYAEKLDRHFEVFARDSKLYQSEFQVGSDQQEVFRDTRQRCALSRRITI
jgi:hypothetical protein